MLCVLARGTPGACILPRLPSHQRSWFGKPVLIPGAFLQADGNFIDPRTNKNVRTDWCQVDFGQYAMVINAMHLFPLF